MIIVLKGDLNMIKIKLISRYYSLKDGKKSNCARYRVTVTPDSTNNNDDDKSQKQAENKSFIEDTSSDKFPQN